MSSRPRLGPGPSQEERESDTLDRRGLRRSEVQGGRVLRPSAVPVSRSPRVLLSVSTRQGRVCGTETWEVEVLGRPSLTVGGATHRLPCPATPIIGILVTRGKSLLDS